MHMGLVSSTFAALAWAVSRHAWSDCNTSSLPVLSQEATQANMRVAKPW